MGQRSRITSLVYYSASPKAEIKCGLRLGSCLKLRILFQDYVAVDIIHFLIAVGLTLASSGLARVEWGYISAASRLTRVPPLESSPN